jgi:hypothetical protein
MTPIELLARLAAIVPPPRYPLLRYAGVFASGSPWRPFVVPQPPHDASHGHGGPCSRHPHRADDPTGAAPPHGAPEGGTPVGRKRAAIREPRGLDASPGPPDPLLGVPPPLPRTLSDEHWRRLDDGGLFARQPRVDWATLLRRTFVEDILCCPRCRGRMALVETVTDEHDVHRRLAALGLPFEPATFRSAHDPDDAPTCDPPRRTGRDPPTFDADPDAGPSPPDDSGVPAWSDDCPPSPDDDTSQLPPDAEV